MARLARVPGVAYPLTQRGNRREAVFFGGDGCRADILWSPGAGEHARRARHRCVHPISCDTRR
jgi:hypothetical protein